MPEKLKESKVKIPMSEKHSGKATKQNLTIIAKCNCVNEFQDKMYGRGMRVKNSTQNGYRCTVCRK